MSAFVPAAPGARSRRQADVRGANAKSGEADRFKIGPLCRWVLPVSELADWVDRAQAGERIAYARGLALSAGTATVLLVRELGAAGFVQSNMVPVPLDGGGREFEWIAIRLKREATSPAQAPCGATDIGALALAADFDAGRVLAMLKRAATFAQVCPTNGEIAEALGLRGHERARYLIGKLITAGVIEVTHDGPAYRRVVRILPDGPSTVEGRL